ncbi:MAG TPA: recombinase family protein [bacterium]|nr:recombinase family protein [bacterium]
MKKTIGYIRVSTEEQAREGISLDNQRSKIDLYCRINDFELVGIESDEGISGKDLNRPGVKRILDMAKNRQIDSIVIYKLDRLFRNTTDALTTATMLDKKGIALHSICEKLDTQSAIGKFFFTLVASLAEMERNIISERTADAMQSMKASGKSTGVAPYGFRLSSDGIHLEPDEAEQVITGLIVKLRSRLYTYQGIADELNEKGYRNRKGNIWRPQYVRGVYIAVRGRDL